MFSSLTPANDNDLRTPATRAEMMAVFHRAWTMAIRSLEPGDAAWFSQLVAVGRIVVGACRHEPARRQDLSERPLLYNFTKSGLMEAFGQEDFTTQLYSA